MIIEKSEFSKRQIAKLVKGTVVPRPIAWISSVGKTGIPNLAPFSYFQVISHDPVMFIISIGQGYKVGKDGDKDTLANIKETGDFVINMVSASLASHMQKSSEIFPKNVSEFEKTGLTPVKSQVVTAPRVEEAVISMECTLNRVMELGDFNQVIGELACYHIKDEVYMEGDKINYETYDPIGRLAANYTYVRDLFFPDET
ncbi:MAG: flavin reductase family protein [Gracilimonas sp.]|uniref:flavin reductase family protein n=1 Tax=Gracilimonas sp. TaxID=1974203 RepID=UPI0019885826|nr:flavin reductase family protein [Gracilimonas sp.]MBD3616964.1 flavin reductase family protein [Gracilimonas sp.]